MKNIKHYFKGFTLVELIIVITILVILATIAFISFQNYSGDARDANRLSTIKNIEPGFELFTLKTGNYPKPDEVKIFTGGIDGKSQLNQGIIGENVSRVISLNSIPLDPKDKSNYVYSTTGNNQYYQIGIDSENRELSFIPQTYAQSKTSIVRGNYRFDPSLPSLIVVENEALTNSGIFSPEVCFVLNNGKNSLHECNQIKSEMNGKNYDNFLISYWDMETSFSSGEIQYLKDLSGNGNHGGIFTNSSLIEKPIIGNGNIGIMGESTKFYSSGTGGFIKLLSQAYRFDNSKGITIIGFVKDNDFSEGHKCMWKFHRNIATQWGGSLCFNQGNYGVHGGTSASGNSAEATHNLTGALNMDFSKWNMVTGVIDYQNKTLKYYQNGILIDEKKVYFSQNFYTYQDGDTENISDNIGFGTAPNPSILNGYLDEVKIYNRALSDEEILQQSKIAGF